MVSNPFQELSVKIGADTSGFTSALDDAMSKLGSFKNAAAGLGAVAGGALTAGFVKSIDAAADFEQALADVEKVAGDQANMDELRDGIQDMAAEVPLAHDQLADLAAQAGRMGAEGEEEILSFTRVAAEMGAATTLSADQAGRALGKVASALDEPMENMRGLGDAINETSNNFEANSEEIVDSTQRAGQALSTLGLQSDEIIGLAGAFNELSPTSRVAATRMQMVSEALQDPENIEMFADAVGMSADEFKNLLEESPEEALLEVMRAVDEGRLSFEDLNENLRTEAARAFRDTASGVDEMAEAMGVSNEAMEEGGSLAREVAVETDTLSGQYALFKNQVRSLAQDIGQAFLPALTNLARRANLLIDRFRGLVDGLSDAQIRAAGVASAFTTVASMVAILNPALGGLIAVTGALASAWVSDFGNIRTSVTRVRDVLKEEFVDTVRTLDDVLGEPLSDTEGLFTSFRDTVRDALGDIDFDLTERIVKAIRTVGDVVRSRLQEMALRFDEHRDKIAAARETYRDLRDRVTEILHNLRQKVAYSILFLTDKWEEHRSKIEGPVRDAYESARDTITTVLPEIRSRVREGVAFLTGKWEEHRSKIEGPVREAYSKIRDHIGTVADGVKELANGKWQEGFNAILNTVLGVKSDIRTALVGEDGNGGVVINAIKKIGTWLEENGKGIIETGFGAIGTVVEESITGWRIIAVGEDGSGGVINTLFTQLTDFLENNGKTMVEEGMKTVEGVFETGFENIKIAAVGEDGSSGTIRTMFSEMKDFLQSEDGGKGMVRTGFNAVGMAIGNFFEDLIKGIVTDDESAIEQLFGAMNTYLEEQAWDDIKAGYITFAELLHAAFLGLAEGIINGREAAVKQWFADIKTYLEEDAWSDIKEGWNTFSTKLVDALDNLSKTLFTGEDAVVKQWFSDFKTYLEEDAWSDIKEGFKSFGESLIEKGWNALSDVIIGNDDSAVKQWFADLKTYLTDGAWNDIKEGFKSFGTSWLEEGWESLRNVIINNDDSIVKNAFSDIKTYLKEDAWNDIKEGAESVLNDWASKWEEFKTWLIGDSFIPDMFKNDIKDYLQNDAWNDIKEGFKSAIDSWKEKWNSFVDNVINNDDSIIKEMFSSIKTWVEETGKKKAKNAFETVVSKIEEKLNGIDLSGIKSAIDTVISKAETAINKASNIPDVDLGGSGGDGGDGGDPTDVGSSPGVLHTGGRVPHTGLYRLLQGEMVVNQSVPGSGGGGGGGQPVVIDAPPDSLIRVGDLNSLMRQTFDDKWDEKRRRLR